MKNNYIFYIYLTIYSLGLGKKNIDFSILIDSRFNETIFIPKSQESISLALFQVMNGTLYHASHPVNHNKLCALLLLIWNSLRFQILSILLQ